MGYSNIVFSSMALVDIVVPGAPQLALARTGSREIEARVTLPAQDADGNPLTGMTELIIAILAETAPTVNPFDGVDAASMDSFAESNGGQSTIIFVSDADAGQLKATRFSNLNVGDVYWVGTTVKDES